MRQRLVIIGSGYVGLVSGVCLASKGHQVTCVDNDINLVTRIKSGIPHIFEAGLEKMLMSVLNTGNFDITSNLDSTLAKADGVMVAVGTPTRDGEIDLTALGNVANKLGLFLKDRDVTLPIIIKSTVLPGVTDGFVRKSIQENLGESHGIISLGMNPEFLREGNAVDDFMHPDRLILGYEDESAKHFLRALYEPWNCKKLFVNTRTAELIKYANNALLATQISAINEIANLANAAGGINMREVVAGIHLDKRWSPIINGKRIKTGILDYLSPGCGYGGSCFPKDIRALKAFGSNLGMQTKMLNAVMETNDKQPLQVTKILQNNLEGLSHKKILVLGLAFKPETDDVRESPSIKIISSLEKNNAIVFAHDPKAMDNFKALPSSKSLRVSFVEDWRSYVQNSDAILIVTSWKEYLRLEECDLSSAIVFDVRRIFISKSLKCAKYLSLG